MAAAWESNPSVLVGILHTDVVTMAWALGLRNLQGNISVVPVAGMPYDHARNALCMMTLDHGFEYCLMLDSDVIPPHDAVVRLLRHNLPIISGVYHRRSPPHGKPVMMINGQWVEQYDRGKIIEVDVVGAGCLLIRRDVLQKLPPQDPERGKHWFHWRVDMNSPNLQHPAGHPLSEDYTFCFPAGTWVNGWRTKRIEEVKIGDRVVTHTGSFQRVVDTGKRMYSGEMVTIEADFVGKVESTTSHRFLVKRTRKTGIIYPATYVNQHFKFGEIGETVTRTINHATRGTEWVEAGKVEVGNWLYIPKTKPCPKKEIKTISLSHLISTNGLHQFPDGLLGYKRTRKDALRIHPTIKITPGLCRLIGYYLSEGFCGGGTSSKMKGRHSVHFAFGSHETEYVRDCKELLMLEFGAESSTTTENGCSRIVTNSRILGRLFSAFGGNGAHNKHFPRFWSRLGKRNLSEMLKGYWRGDGYVRGDNLSFSVTTMSEQLAREVQAAFLRLGVLCGLKGYESNYGIKYVIDAAKLHGKRFAEIVGWEDPPIKDPKNNWRFRETKKHFLVKVRSVSKRNVEREVYNLTVGVLESYTANVIAVHNCRFAREKLGIPILVDTSIQCRHIGLAQFEENSVLPLNCTPNT